MITIWVPKRLVEVDLYNVAARSPQALAQLSENSYARRVQYAAQKVRGSGAKIVMLTGPSASGKTTSAHCLAKALVQQGTPAQVVSLDNFFKGAAYYPKMPDGTLDYENLETLDLPLIKQCLHQLSETGKTELPIYDFATEQRAAAVEPIDLQGGVCIVEGIHALNPELTGLVPDDQIYRIYAGLREEYCIDGRRVINTQDIRTGHAITILKFKGCTLYRICKHTKRMMRPFLLLIVYHNNRFIGRCLGLCRMKCLICTLRMLICYRCITKIKYWHFYSSLFVIVFFIIPCQRLCPVLPRLR